MTLCNTIIYFSELFVKFKNVAYNGNTHGGIYFQKYNLYSQGLGIDCRGRGTKYRDQSFNSASFQCDDSFLQHCCQIII
jgi:hypothetical protein